MDLCCEQEVQNDYYSVEKMRLNGIIKHCNSV